MCCELVMKINNLGKKFFINSSLVILIFLIDRISKIYVISLNKKFVGSEIFSSKFLNISLIWIEGIAFGLFSFKNQDIYNILTTNSTPREITNIIKKYIDDISIEFVESKIMNQLSYEVSKDSIEKEGFEFKSNIQEGIKETIEYLADEKYFK